MPSQIPKGEVDLLPDNFMLNNMLAMLTLLLKRGSLGCDNCDSGDPPVNRCATCFHFLCEICTMGHKRGRSTKSHHLLNLEEAVEEGPMAVYMSRPSFCKEHNGEMLKLFCETCDKTVCSDCTVVKHQGHKCIFVSDAFENGKNNVRKILSKTKTQASTLKSALDGISAMKRSIESQAKKAVEEIGQRFQDLTVSLHTRSEELVSGVQELKKAKLNTLQIQQEELELALDIVQSSVGFTEKTIKHGSEVEILNLHKQISNRLQELNSSTWHLVPRTDDAIKFIVEKELKGEVSSFGVVTDVMTNAETSTVMMGHGSEGLIYSTLCGQPVQFTIIAREWNGKKRVEGGDPFTASCDSGAGFKALEVKDCGDGTYIFSYTPEQEGQYKLVVKLLGRDVSGGPFTWSVEKWHLLCVSGSSKGEVLLSEEKLTAQYNLKSAVTSAVSKPYSNASCFTSGQKFTASNSPFGSTSTSTASSLSNGISQKSKNSHNNGGTGRPFGANSWDYVVSSTSFYNGKHSCKAKLIGNIQEGFSLGVISTCRRLHGNLASLGNWWVWNSKQMKHLLLSSNMHVKKSSITDFESNDIVEMYLDCDEGTLIMFNQRTKESDIWYGINGDTCPVFHMTSHGDQVSLLV